VGKTTLAFAISDDTPSVYLYLEDRTDLRKVEDMAAFHQANHDKLIIHPLDQLPGRAPGSAGWWRQQGKQESWVAEGPLPGGNQPVASPYGIWQLPTRRRTDLVSNKIFCGFSSSRCHAKPSPIRR